MREVKILTDKLFTKEQMNILRSCASGADLAADIAHAHVTIYVPDEDPKNILVYAQAQPLPKFVVHSPGMAGRIIRRVEEPLVARALQRGALVVGKREWALGVFAKTKIYPLFDSHRNCFGAVAFEISTEHEANANDIFLETAMKFLLGADQNKMKNDENYRRLTPSDGVMIVNKDMIITAANNTAHHIFLVLGVTDLVGRRTNSVQINWPLVGMVLKTGIAEGKELSTQGIKLAMRVIPLTATPDSEAAIVILADVTELRKKDEELYIQSVVIKEIHHRVKNNLQTIASLLRLQARRTESDEAKSILRDAINRVNSIALVHESLSQQDKGEINVSVVAREIYQAILSSMVAPDLKLETTFVVDSAFLPSEQANSIALTLNELLQNAIEHGFSDRKTGKLSVSFKAHPDGYVLEITDDGMGLPPNFKLGQTKSLGLKIIQTMVETDLGGRFEILPRVQGTCARVTVPMKMGEQTWKS